MVNEQAGVPFPAVMGSFQPIIRDEMASDTLESAGTTFLKARMTAVAKGLTALRIHVHMTPGQQEGAAAIVDAGLSAALQE